MSTVKSDLQAPSIACFLAAAAKVKERIEDEGNPN